MIRFSFRIWAGVLALFLLPVFVLASDNNSNSNNSSNSSSAPSASESSSAASAAAPTVGIAASPDPLLRLMVSQGLLTPDDVTKLAGVPSAELRDRLLLILLMKNKNALSAEDMNALKAPAAEAATTVAAPAAAAPTGAAPTAAANAALSSKDVVEADQATGPPQAPLTPPPAGPIPAVAPIRVLAIDPPKREGIIPVINVNRSVRIQPYGFIKASAVYDTSSPYGNDFPLPGFNAMPNGPNMFPEFHVKARFIRVGGNFEWVDSPRLVLTGKIEADFEGNFSAVNNRNISSIRASDVQIRLGYARLDYKPNDLNSVFVLFGQDWTPFTSSTLPNLFETTGLGVGFGTLYERLPQFRFGFEHAFGSPTGFKLGPEFAIVLPAFGNVPGTASAVTLQNQIGFGERQGVDSAEPEIQARIVGQWQLDHAAGVAPAQIILSGVHGNRSLIVPQSGVPTTLTIAGVTSNTTIFTTAFPQGVSINSKRNAWTGEIQLPTRFATLVAKYYNGSDLRFYFGGQIYPEFNDTVGITDQSAGTSVDGSGPAPVFGCRGGVGPTCTGGTIVVANQLPPRSQGGFVNLGLPLSRWANANPAGRNAGWVLYLHYGYDQVLARDVRRLNANATNTAFASGREKGDLGAATLQYKLNNFVTFIVEESYYRTRALASSTGTFPIFDGRQMREWNDKRSEFGPLFTF